MAGTRVRFTLLIAMLATTLAAACTQTTTPELTTATWVGGDEGIAVVADLTTATGTGDLSGTVRIAEVGADGTMLDETIDVSGRVTGDRITLTAARTAGATETWSGEYDAGLLALTLMTANGTTTLQMDEGTDEAFDLLRAALEERASQIAAGLQQRRDTGQAELTASRQRYQAALARLEGALASVEDAQAVADETRANLADQITDLEAVVEEYRVAAGTDLDEASELFRVIGFRYDVIKRDVSIFFGEQMLGRLTASIAGLSEAADDVEVAASDLLVFEARYLRDGDEPTDPSAVDRVVAEARAASEEADEAHRAWLAAIEGLSATADELLEAAERIGADA